MLGATDHRPWPVPARRWVMAQAWHDLLFAHWPVRPDALRPLVPPSLAIDTFGGDAWLGIVPFHMSGVRLRGLPPVPGLAAFAEINVRTYVTAEGKPGIFFLSLDADSPLAVAAARRWYRLPYYRARMAVEARDDRIRYRSRRTDRRAPPAEFGGTYGPTGDPCRARAGSLEHELTERYCLYTLDLHGRLLRGEIHHAPWPLQPAAADIERNTMALAHGIALPTTPPLLHFAGRVDAFFWRLQPAGKSEG